MNGWWDRFPEVYRREHSELDRLGIRYERSESAWEAGVLQFHLWPVVNGEEVNLVATYPDLYPFFRFEVQAPNAALVRHQNPFTTSLCLIGRSTDNWEVDDSLAWFIEHQVPKVLRLGSPEASEDDLTIGEEHQGEPFSDYYPYQRDALLVVDSDWAIPDDALGGSLLLRVAERSDALLRGVVTEIRDSDGQVLGSYPVPEGLFSRELRARWFRMPSEVREPSAEGLVHAVHEVHKEARREARQRLGQFVFDVYGVLFPEEVTWRSSGNGWVFAVQWRPAKQPKQRRADDAYYFARAGRAGPGDLEARIPEAAVLPDKTISILGLGGLGGPSALEFGRAQVGRLRLADHDFVDPGTCVRWPLGLPACGVPKIEIGRFIEQQWPFVNVTRFEQRLGSVGEGAVSKRDLDFVQAFLGQTDLIYDASAELGIQYFLSEEARERHLPYVAVDATYGAWGGRVVRIVPDQTDGCWLCSRAAFASGDFDLPPADPAGAVQPRGCADPTFTGLAFDLLPLIAEGVRAAVATLCRGSDKGYPDIDWDVAVLRLRNEDGPVPPTWVTYRLHKHELCPRCGAK